MVTDSAFLTDFNPRSPHGERLLAVLVGVFPGDVFQPTLPARGATDVHGNLFIVHRDFNPRSPHGERPRRPRPCGQARRISTHAPRTGSDINPGQKEVMNNISTHAPRTGSDLTAYQRPWWEEISTHAPRTGSDRVANAAADDRHISTHAPRTGSDSPRRARGWPAFHFNPRSPHGERPSHCFRPLNCSSFQPTLPARGATSLPRCPRTRYHYFNPRSPHGERQVSCARPRFDGYFNPRSPHGERPEKSAFARC